MAVFLTLLLKIIPLYVIMGFGFVAGKLLHVKKESIAPLLIYIIAPIIVFNAALTTDLTVGALTLPVLFFTIASCIAIVFLHIGKYFWHDSTRNILAFTAGAGNVGYFGVPVAMTIFNESAIGLVVLSVLGIILYENSVGFFITAKGTHTAQDALKKVLKLPTIYAFILGLTVNLMGISFGQIYADSIFSFRGAYTVLGMMLIGLGLAGFSSFAVDYVFLGLTFLAKFIIWPLIMLLIITADIYYLHIYSPEIHRVIVLMSVVPLAANTVAYATELKAQPEKAALTVFLSTIFALIYIPLVVVLFLS